MKIINKKKFLAELSKLLSFMFEEDRQTAVAMYEKMFEMAPDEDALITYLMSPTRQAVLIARSYDAKERKLSIKAEDGNDAALVSGEEPARFIETIREIFSDALDVIPDILDEKTEKAAAAASEKVNEEVAQTVAVNGDINWVKETPAVGNVVVANAPKSEPVAEPIEETKVETKIVEEPKTPSEDVVDAFLRELSINLDEIDGKSDNTQVAEVKDSLPETVAAKPLDVEETPVTVETPADNIDVENLKFASDFEGLEDTDFALDEVYVPEKYPEEEDKPKKKGFGLFKKSRNEYEDDEDELGNGRRFESFENETEHTDGKLRGGKLVIFLLIAIPLAALGLILTFSIALVFLALAGAALLMAFRTFQAAFDSFKVFADLLVVAGSGLCITAVGVLLFWSFIYFAVGLPAKIVNGVINLCMKICSKKEDDEE